MQQSHSKPPTPVVRDTAEDRELTLIVTNPGGTGHEWVHQRFIAEDRELTLIVKVRTYGKPEQVMQSASRIKGMLQTGLDSSVKVYLVDDPGSEPVEVPDLSYERIE